MLQRGGYIFADYPEVFDTTDLTIEGWFYLNRLPKKRERWMLFSKPGSYLLEIDVPNLDNPFHASDQKGILFMEGLLSSCGEPHSSLFLQAGVNPRLVWASSG